jgi:hypothetical protein
VQELEGGGTRVCFNWEAAGVLPGHAARWLATVCGERG